MSNELPGLLNPTPQTNDRKPSPVQPLLFALTLIAGMFIGTNLGDKNLLQVKPSVEQNANKLVSLIDFIEDNYVDSINKQQLIEDAIASVLKNLDPHSYYMGSEEVALEKERMKGEFSGVGIEFLILRDSLMVVKTIAGGPSEKAGLQSGDRIVMVDGQVISGKELNGDKAQKLLKGKQGSQVRVAVVRPGESGVKEFNIERGSIPIESVNASFMVNDSVGYIRIDRFAEKTYDEFWRHRKSWKKTVVHRSFLICAEMAAGYSTRLQKLWRSFLRKEKPSFAQEASTPVKTKFDRVKRASTAI